MSMFVGRTDALARLAAAYEAVLEARVRVAQGRPGLVLVSGEAGMGKTSLLTRFAADVAARGARPMWGTCWDADQAPAFWAWTQVLRSLLGDQDDLREQAGSELAPIVPALAAAAQGSPDLGADDSGARLRVFDAVGRVLARAVARDPVIVILDDLQRADASTLDLLRFLMGVPLAGALLVVGAYRPDELDDETGAGLARLATSAQQVTLRGLSAAEVAQLVEAFAGTQVAELWGHVVHERSDGHPFFARELTYLLASGGAVGGVPAAVREVIARRLARVSIGCARMLEAASVAGAQLVPDVLAYVTAEKPTHAGELIREAVAARLLTEVAEAVGVRFAHDLHRESIYASLASGQRLELHHRIGEALLQRHERGGQVFTAELARHFAAAVPMAGPTPALAWARAAAAEERARFAFAEAAGHLARARAAITESGDRLSEADLVDLLAAEADARLRAGDATASRELLDTAWQRALELDDPGRMGTVALGLDRVGARFAMPRADLVSVLDRARQALVDTDTPAEALVTAALARQRQHSVPKDRPRASPLAERAVAIARTGNDPATLASCLLAHHDALWTPGTQAERAIIASEIADLAEVAGDPERHAQALLLTASALLEAGSPAFRAALAEYEYATERLREPRHDYLLRTRQAALALLDGDIDAGDRLSAEAAAEGEAALVCFMGAHAHRIGLLYLALGQAAEARHWLRQALDTHRTLGARAWEAETSAALAAFGSDDAHEDAGADPPALHRVGDMWQASFRGRTAYLRDAKGLHDLAALLSRPGVDLPALELAGAAPAGLHATAGDPVLDRAALSAYRRRLTELDEELSTVQHANDLGQAENASHEREQLLAELRRSTRPGGKSRPLGPTAAERARKAVTARIRDAIRRIGHALPELGTHLDRTIRTGTTCRYDP